MKLPLLILILAGLAPLASAAGELSFFQLAPGGPGGPGDVLVADEAGASAPTPVAGLSGVQLLPLDFVGRTQLDELLPDRPRLRQDVPGAARIELPAGRGSLYRYRRALGAGTSVFGFFAVGADGRARALAEHPATPAGGDPFVARVAIAAAGDAALVATTVAAGGNVFEVDLGGGAFVDRTSHVGPLDVAADGLALFGTWGVAVTSLGIGRFDRAPGALVQPVPFAPGETPAWLSGQLASSADGLHCATTGGSGPPSAHVFRFGPSGTALRVTSQPANLSGAGALPASLAGPFLALSADGSHCAWRTEGLTREAFLARVPVAAAPAPEQITSDARFLDTLDEAGVMHFVGPTELLLAVGARDDPLLGGLEDLDVYRAELTPGGALALTNLTLSSGLVSPPFTVKSQINAEDGIFRLPGSGAVLLHARTDSAERVIAVDPFAGATTLVDGVKELNTAAIAGDRLLVTARRKATGKQELYRLPLDLSAPAALFALLPEDARLERISARPDGVVGTVITLGAAEFLARADLATGAVQVLSTLPFSFGPTTDFTAAGRLAFSAGALGASLLLVTWPDGAPLALAAAPAASGFLLPGS